MCLQAGRCGLAIYGTLILNFSDFSRSSPCCKTIKVGNFWGLPVNILVFAGITVLLCGAQFQINGQIIESPTQIIASIPKIRFFLVLGCLAFLIVTVSGEYHGQLCRPGVCAEQPGTWHLTFRHLRMISATVQC